MDTNAIRAASQMLVTCWREGARLAALPDALRPASRDEGYAIQAELEIKDATPLFGWKIAATSAAGQAHIGVDGPLAGRILADRVITPDGVCSIAKNQMRVAEFEFAFRFGRDLPPHAEPYARDEVLAAVASLHPAIEIPDSRFLAFETAGAPQLIADNACADQFVLGAAAPDAWRMIDLSRHEVLATVAARTDKGIGANVLGDPRDALLWIVRELTGLGLTLRSGQVVTTGTCITPMAIAPGERVFGDFGALGTVAVRIV